MIKYIGALTQIQVQNERLEMLMDSSTLGVLWKEQKHSVAFNS